MYSSNYTHVPRYTVEAQRKKQQMQRSKGKSCGYYTRIVFFFSSLIQSLIIVGLVLFLVYGKKQDSAAAGRIADLEQSFSRLSLENVALQQQKKNLTKSLNATAAERLQMNLDLARMRNLSDTSRQIISDFDAKLTQCNAENRQLITNSRAVSYLQPRQIPIGEKQGGCVKDEHQKAKEQYLQSQLNQTVLENTIKIDKLNKERDDLSLEAINLRNDKQMLESEIANYRLLCEKDFVASLSGISNVSRAFLEKINSLFSLYIPLQLTCEKQRENLEQIRTNCTSLSRDVEDKFQRYLDNLGARVSDNIGKISHLEAENQRLTKDYHLCSLNRTGMILEHRQHLQKAQLRCDDTTKNLLTEKKLLKGEKDLLDNKMRVKETEILHLKEQNKLLNSSCWPRNSFPLGTGRFQVGGSSSSAGNPQRFQGSTSNVNTGSTGPSLGAGSTGLNKLTTNGLNGALNVGLTGSIGMDPGKKPALPSLGSTNLGSPWSSSYGVSSTRLLGGAAPHGSNWSSTGTGLGSSTTGLGKQPTGSSGSKVQASSGTGGWGTGLGKFGPTSTELGNTGFRNTALGTSILGRGTGSAGSVGGIGGGRTGGTGSGNVAQHLQDLQRYGKPSSAEKKN